MNENKQRLLELCEIHGLAITNTLYSVRPIQNVSWRHPRSAHWYQLDFVIVRRHDLNSCQSCRFLQSADCNTDHALVLARLNLLKKAKQNEICD